MKIYAIRDRLIDYYMQPFPAHSDKDVLNSLANMLSMENNSDPVAQAPHHFEIWKLCEIDNETGLASGKPEFLADCAGLIRPGRQPAVREAADVAEAQKSLRRAVDRALDETGAYERPAALQAPKRHSQGTPPAGGPGRTPGTGRQMTDADNN